MKFLVGETSEGTSVFVVKGDEAVNITALNAEIGSDLTGLISNPALADSVAAQISDAATVPVDSITPALPVRNVTKGSLSGTGSLPATRTRRSSSWG